MPEFIEIKDEIFKVSELVRITTDVYGIGTESPSPIIRVITSREDYAILFDNEESCKDVYLKVRDILLKNTQNLKG